MHLQELESGISVFMRQYSDYIWIGFGVLLIVGAIQNWDWLCDPVGKPDFVWKSRGVLRCIFFSCGVILVGCGLYFVIKRFS